MHCFLREKAKWSFTKKKAQSLQKKHGSLTPRSRQMIWKDPAEWETQVLSLLGLNQLVSSVCISLFVSSIDASVSYIHVLLQSTDLFKNFANQRSQAVTEALPFARAHQIDSQSWGILHLQQAAARLIARRFGDSEVTWQSNPGTNLYPTMPPKLWQGICCLTPIPDSDCFHLQVAVRLEWWEYLKAHFQNFDLLHWRRNWMTLEVFVQRHLVLENSHQLEELEHVPHGHGQQLVQCPRPG